LGKSCLANDFLERRKQEPKSEIGHGRVEVVDMSAGQAGPAGIAYSTHPPIAIEVPKPHSRTSQTA
jgi:hypothetical protein